MSKLALKHVSAAALTAASLAAGLWVTEARADLQVFVGYADNLRASGFFPNPWIGAPGVVSQTVLADNPQFDAGAVRIDNTGASAVTISNMTVTLNGGANVFTLWGSLIIPAGGNGIFTQTGEFNFDTSDFAGAFPFPGTERTVAGNNGIGGCSSPASIVAAAGVTGTCAANVPTVTFSADGAAAKTFDDTGHIIDTGFYDFINGSADGNESINWNVIGTEANRGGTGGVPEPSTWVMMLLGFAGLGFAAHRARKSDKPAFAL